MQPAANNGKIKEAVNNAGQKKNDNNGNKRTHLAGIDDTKAADHTEGTHLQAQTCRSYVWENKEIKLDLCIIRKKSLFSTTSPATHTQFPFT